MKIQCPSCQLEGNIPDEKIPEGGGTIKCPKCENKIRVSKETPIEFNSDDAPPGQPFFCPKCKTEQPKSEACTKCGLIFPKYIARQDKSEADQINEADQLDANSTKAVGEKKKNRTKTGVTEEKTYIKALKKTIKTIGIVFVSVIIFFTIFILILFEGSKSPQSSMSTSISVFDYINLFYRDNFIIINFIIASFVSIFLYIRAKSLKVSIISFPIVFVSIFVFAVIVLPTASEESRIDYHGYDKVISGSNNGSTKAMGESRNDGAIEINYSDCSDGCQIIYGFAPGTKDYSDCISACLE